MAHASDWFASSPVWHSLAVVVVATAGRAAAREVDAHALA